MCMCVHICVFMTRWCQFVKTSSNNVLPAITHWQVISHMEIWYLRLNKMRILPQCWYYCMIAPLLFQQNARKKKTWWETHKNALYCFEQIPEAAPNKVAVVWPLTSCLTNHQSKINKTGWALLEMQPQTHKQCFPVDSSTWAHQCWLTNRNFDSSAYAMRRVMEKKHFFIRSAQNFLTICNSVLNENENFFSFMGLLRRGTMKNIHYHPLISQWSGRPGFNPRLRHIKPFKNGTLYLLA